MRSALPCFALLATLLLNATAPAQDEGGTLPGFSEAHLLSLSRSSDPAACVKFEATFSKPLQQPPKVTLDMARADLIEGVVSFVLRATRIARDRYSYAATDLDAAACRKLRKNPYVISVEGGLGPDERPLLPDQRSYSPR